MRDTVLLHSIMVLHAFMRRNINMTKAMVLIAGTDLVWMRLTGSIIGWHIEPQSVIANCL